MYPNKSLSYASVFILAISVSGCATIVTGSQQPVTFNSNPDGATVSVAGRTIGKTPITTSMKKESGQALVFEKEGYKPLTMQLETQLNPWFWGNIVIGGLIGSTTDGLSGAVYEYSPNQYMVTLQPAGTGSLETPTAPSEGTSSLETHTALSESQKRKDYIVRNYESLIKELQNGPAAQPGEYLASLLSLLNVKPNLEYDAIKRIRALSVAYPDIVEFADHVVEAFGG